jgi:hypothetical protein
MGKETTSGMTRIRSPPCRSLLQLDARHARAEARCPPICWMPTPELFIRTMLRRPTVTRPRERHDICIMSMCTHRSCRLLRLNEIGSRIWKTPRSRLHTCSLPRPSPCLPAVCLLSSKAYMCVDASESDIPPGTTPFARAGFLGDMSGARRASPSCRTADCILRCTWQELESVGRSTPISDHPGQRAR